MCNRQFFETLAGGSCTYGVDDFWCVPSLPASAEHGITLFETAADGTRLSTRYAPGYFRMIRDFARDGRLHGKYGDAELTTPPR